MVPEVFSNVLNFLFQVPSSEKNLSLIVGTYIMRLLELQLIAQNIDDDFIIIT